MHQRHGQRRPGLEIEELVDVTGPQSTTLQPARQGSDRQRQAHNLGRAALAPSAAGARRRESRRVILLSRDLKVLNK